MKNISKKDFIITVIIIISCAIVGEIFTYKMATESSSKDISSINGKASTFAIGSGTFVTLSDHNNELQAQRTSGYNEGYNAGIAAADARANSSSVNYQTGYTTAISGLSGSYHTANTSWLLGWTSYGGVQQAQQGSGKTVNVGVSANSITINNVGGGELLSIYVTR